MRIKGRSIFNLVLLTLILIMVVLAIDYNPKARLIPLVVGSLTLFMLIVQFLIDQFPGIKSKLSFLERGSFEKESNEIEQDSEKRKEGNDSDPTHSWLLVFQIFIWLLGFVLLLYLTPYFFAVPLFLFFFIWISGKATIKSSLGIAIGTSVCMYVLFDLILQTRI